VSRASSGSSKNKANLIPQSPAFQPTPAGPNNRYSSWPAESSRGSPCLPPARGGRPMNAVAGPIQPDPSRPHGIIGPGWKSQFSTHRVGFGRFWKALRVKGVVRFQDNDGNASFPRRTCRYHPPDAAWKMHHQAAAAIEGFQDALLQGGFHHGSFPGNGRVIDLRYRHARLAGHIDPSRTAGPPKVACIGEGLGAD